MGPTEHVYVITHIIYGYITTMLYKHLLLRFSSPHTSKHKTNKLSL